jgi:hypothetical protein
MSRTLSRRSVGLGQDDRVGAHGGAVSLCVGVTQPEVHIHLTVHPTASQAV